MQNLVNIINQNSAFIIIGLTAFSLLLLILVIVLFQALNRVERKYRKMMRGVNNKNLEQLIEDNLSNIENSLEQSKKAMDKCDDLKEEIKGCVNKVAILRYKAFEDIGSDLSFSIAILDSYNDGVIITGIYGRQQSTTYAKPIDKGISRYDLSEEEIHVLNEAINK